MACSSTIQIISFVLLIIITLVIVTVIIFIIIVLNNVLKLVNDVDTLVIRINQIIIPSN